MTIEQLLEEGAACRFPRHVSALNPASFSGQLRTSHAHFNIHLVLEITVEQTTLTQPHPNITTIFTSSHLHHPHPFHYLLSSILLISVHHSAYWTYLCGALCYVNNWLFAGCNHCAKGATCQDFPDKWLQRQTNPHCQIRDSTLLFPLSDCSTSRLKLHQRRRAGFGHQHVREWGS